ncbi:hypothetical protein LEM8419_01591 [Neolewinella maritima]|uniref:Xylose isomerase-like TIM barrel domain-containing protein n=1 Tax=Neolewinella maritima TaxID=1383882 RepID=A0ABM9B021_9BACT|nr:sugar phosphate isomerase/epimerase family protein [Neolewinella maritima]CAH1000438.1 hypothetical protein LEM8419_01591 [Neolewinella maritima]
MKLRYAYNTNGCAHHRLNDALRLIADSGYDGVALTIDWHHLDPFSDRWQADTYNIHRSLEELGLSCVIETGARYLLDATDKHEPTLISTTAEGRARRVAFLKRAIDIAGLLHAETMSFWAGVRKSAVSEQNAHQYLGEGLLEVASYAEEKSVHISLEPEPGMLVETNADYDQLLTAHPELERTLHLALDLGHVWVTGEDDPARAVHRYADRLGTVSIEGMNKGQHLHLPLDQGDMDIPPLLRALRDVAFDRLVCVELSRESVRAHEAIPRSIDLLKQMERAL